MGAKLTFEEVAKKIKEFNYDYELVEYVNNKNLTLKYLPTGEEFKCCLRWFLKGKAHAPSIVKEVKLEKQKKTNLEKYGVEYSSQNKEVREKQKKTCFEKYGFEYSCQNKEVQDRIKKTNLERYGVEHPSQNKEIKDKTRKTNLERYGVEYHTQNEEVKDRIKKTNLERYGVECSFQNEEVRDKIKKTNLERYGVENISQNEEIQDKTRKTNLERYGVEYFLQNKKVHENIKKTNLEKYGVKNPMKNKEIQNKVKKTRIEKGYTKLIDGKTVKEISEEKGISYSHINRLERKGIDILNYEKSDGTQIEQTIKSILEQLGLEFEREKGFNVNSIRVDFYIPKFDLVIEANGIYWHSDKVKEKDYHYNRRKTLNDLGFKVIQFNEIEIIEDPVKVKYMIKDIIETGGKESYIYENDYLIVNLDYSIPPTNYELVEEWIEEYEIEGHKIYNSGIQKLIKS